MLCFCGIVFRKTYGYECVTRVDDKGKNIINNYNKTTLDVIEFKEKIIMINKKKTKKRNHASGLFISYKVYALIGTTGKTADGAADTL